MSSQRDSERSDLRPEERELRDASTGELQELSRISENLRLLFAVIWAIDAYLKWLPGYRHDYLDSLKQTA